MDLQMSEMGGLEATRLIRQQESESKSPPVPVFALTPHALNSGEEECMSAGMNGYLRKPFNLTELVKSVEDCGTGDA